MCPWQPTSLLPCWSWTPTPRWVQMNKVRRFVCQSDFSFDFLSWDNLMWLDFLFKYPQSPVSAEWTLYAPWAILSRCSHLLTLTAAFQRCQRVFLNVSSALNSQLLEFPRFCVFSCVLSHLCVCLCCDRTPWYRAAWTVSRKHWPASWTTCTPPPCCPTPSLWLETRRWGTNSSHTCTRSPTHRVRQWNRQQHQHFRLFGWFNCGHRAAGIQS